MALERAESASRGVWVAKAAASLFPLLVEFKFEFLLLASNSSSNSFCGVLQFFGTNPNRVFAQNLRAVALTRGLYVICNAVSQVYKHSDPACLSREPSIQARTLASPHFGD